MTLPKLIIGIDQTGATDSEGRPRKLATAVWESHHQILHTGLYLKSLTENSVRLLIETLDQNYQVNDCFILVDSVLGLPAECKINFQDLLDYAAAENAAQKPYGAKQAYTFFQKFSSGSSNPKRKIEMRLKANSVFNLIPYQRNIGCGTYRILRDLAMDKSWFRVWGQQTPDEHCALLAEVYPSYFWKKHLNSAKRDFAVFNRWLRLNKVKTRPSKISKLGADHADAATAAILAAFYEMHLLAEIKMNSPEGLIFGGPDDP